MIVYVIGNPDVPEDALPIHILPKLQAACPNIVFETKDPNEEWDVPDKLVIIDTVQGIDQVKLFHDLEHFEAAPRVTLHDFDAFAQLALLKKIGKLPPLTIIGVPMSIDENEATRAIVSELKKI